MKRISTIAVSIAIFLVAAAFTAHRFWGLPADQAQMQMAHFWKNIALAGSSLLLIYFGPGPYSVRSHSRVSFPSSFLPARVSL